MYGSTREKPLLARGDGRHVLIVVDDPEIAELLSTTMELAGFRISVADTAGEAVARIVKRRFDLVVLDADLSDMKELAREPRLAVVERPRVLLLAEYDSLDRLLPELGPGETDYVTKPLRIAEVLARAQVLLHGRRRVRREGTVGYGDLVLDDSTCQAWRGQRALDLTPAEYRLLRHLLVNANKVLSKERIGRFVRGEFRGDNAIEQLVSRLRRKVDRDGPPLIHTRRGFGYWLG
ncbi:response regulator transcription factor [Streptomyces avermitilis]|uniref:response regulator transcription factor n=1 Tax=Streptomyces avermitilis TaxID=33903 RepID=UPI0033BAA4FF